MNKIWIPIIGIFLLLGVIWAAKRIRPNAISPNKSVVAPLSQNPKIPDDPLAIATMRARSYLGSQLQIERQLPDESNYSQYIASYLSDGLKIYGLLTVPKGQMPSGGWPGIIFNHGYIPPDSYQTTAKYVTYVTALAKEGYVVFKPDYRGHGQSQGQPDSAYYSPGYATDVLNALASLKQYPQVNPNRIGMWGHSMGGNITLRNIVVKTQDIKAAVIWGGVVGSYDDLINNWQHRVSYHPAPTDLALRNNHRRQFLETYGTPQSNPDFWKSIDPTYYLADITTPVQLHTGGSDNEVPIDFSQKLYQQLLALGKTAEYYNYPGGDHNISSPNFQLAMRRSIEFFNKYLKT